MIDQLDLFYESLPDTVLVLPEKGGPTFIRRKPHAVQYPWLAPHFENVHYLIVDVDRRVTPYEIYDAHLPEPNIISLNRQSGHAQYFWHLEDPVYAWPSQRKNDSYRFYKAIQEGFRASLKGDADFTNYVAKNPLHKHWETHSAYQESYQLHELADWVDLQQHRQVRSRRDLDHAPGRNNFLFDELRHWAYRRYEDARRHAYASWEDQCMVRAMALNTFQEPLSLSEVRSVARSVAKFVYYSYTPHIHRGRDQELITDEMDAIERQRLAAERTNSARKDATATKIQSAVAQLQQQGKRVTKAAVARLAEVDRKTVSRFPHLLL